MPSARPSLAMARVRPITPIFAMPYTAPPGTPPNAAPDATLTNRPPPRVGHGLPGGAAHVEHTAKLRVDHRVDQVVGERRERRHAHLTRVVHHDVDGAERVERGLHDRRRRHRRSRRCRCWRSPHRRQRGSRRRPSCAGFCDRCVGLTVGVADAHSEVVDHDPRARAASSSAYSRPRLRPAPVTIATLPSKRSSFIAASRSGAVKVPAMLEQFRLDDQVAIVTGAGRGIGAAIADVFGEAGADVVLTARTESQLDETAAAVAQSRRARARDPRRRQRSRLSRRTGRPDRERSRPRRHRGEQRRRVDVEADARHEREGARGVVPLQRVGAVRAEPAGGAAHARGRQGLDPEHRVGGRAATPTAAG